MRSGRDDITIEFETDGTTVAVYEVNEAKPAIKCLEKLINCTIRHEIGVAERALDTAVGGVVEYNEAGELMMRDEWILGNGVAIGGEDGFEDIRYLEKGSDSVSGRDSDSDGFVADAEGFYTFL